MTEPARVAVAAPAKVNLFLHVTGRRPDGRHELASLVAFADWADRLTLARAGDFSLHLTGPYAHQVPAGDDNLVLRAARLAAGHFGARDGLAITLDKQLPVAAGLGGGSADAAAVLRGAAALYHGPEKVRQAIAAPALRETATALGADVPVCLVSAPAQVTGIGEFLAEAAPPPVTGLAIAHPGVAVPTAEVFRHYDGAGDAGAQPDFAAPRTAEAFLALLAAQRNDLAAPAGAVAAEASTAVAQLAARPGARLARLSGSGASAFALFDSPAAAATAAAELQQERPGWAVWGGGWADGARSRPTRGDRPAAHLAG